MNEDHINITLFFQGSPQQQDDLRIPTNITVEQLLRELETIYRRTDQTPLKQLKVCNKGILLAGQQKLKDYPVMDGDLIEILEERINDKK